METKELWSNCLNVIELDISKANFSTWFRNTSITKIENGTVFIGVPNEFVKDWLYNKFHKLIFKTLVDFSEEIRAVEYTISKFESKKETSQVQKKEEKATELPLADLYINKEDNLNPKYTFTNFIVGPFNELAFAASQAVVNKPGETYNPFFVYGDTGLGKTHLIQSVGNTIKHRFPLKRIHYITLERFATDLVNSLQTGKANLFKEKYRKYDVLIIDDVQFIGKMEKTQEELFHTFNVFYENNKQIVFSSDKHPNFIPGLEDRLRTRFSAGMIVDIKEPDFESRMAIIKSKLKVQGVDISNESVELIANSLQDSIREIEGSINQIVCQTQIKGKELSQVELKTLLKNNIRPKKSISIDSIVKKIAEFFNLEEKTVYEKTRRKEVVRARQIIMYILREDFNISYPTIGEKMGGKDHTTVIHSYGKIKSTLSTDMSLQEDLDKVRLLFK